jgi:pyruvate dehydrogenase E1 component
LHTVRVPQSRISLRSCGLRYRHHGMDANAIIDAAEALTAGAPVRHRKMAV